MKIETAAVNLTASHESSRSYEIEYETEIGFQQVFRQFAAAPASTAQTRLQARVERLLESLLATMLAAMDGQSCREKSAAPLPAASDPIDDAASATTPTATRSLVWHTRLSEIRCESESTTVCASGTVKTADGREIDFTSQVAMQRDYRSEKVLEESGNVVLHDPLVLNFDGAACELTDARFNFDLDCDGRAESLPGLGAASGFLVFDRNGNGRADDGSELFGARSGDGFAELAALDGDGNGWLDEGDTAFGQLRLWRGAGFGSLAEAGVGALYLSAVDAPFSLKTADNDLLGQIRSAGVYLMENGRAGSLQQVDLAVSAPVTGPQQPEQGQQLAA